MFDLPISGGFGSYSVLIEFRNAAHPAAFNHFPTREQAARHANDWVRHPEVRSVESDQLQLDKRGFFK